ncbi:MAG: hypothetical protein LBI41_00805 [Lactobacillales bacterium]|jgi:hypothetical protein|nr:hypothetical protein [Lactobacillales bacterium]
MIKIIQKLVLNRIKILVLMFFLACITMFLVTLIPNSIVKENVRSGLKTLRDMPPWPSSKLDAAYVGSTLDLYDDNLMLIETIASNKNFIVSAVSFECEQYWNGYFIWLKPLLIFLKYQSILYYINIIIFIFLAIVFTLIYQKTNFYFAIIYIISMIMAHIQNVSQCLAFFTPFFITLIGSIVALNCKRSFYCYMFTFGALECFFDFLTFPLITLGFPLLLFLIVINFEKICTLKKNFLIMFYSSVNWCCGYLLFLILKWMLSTIVLRKNMFSFSIKRLIYRLSNTMPGVDNQNFFYFRLNTIKFNFATMFPTLSIKIMISTLILIVFFILIFGRKKILIPILPILIIAMYPFIWYIVLANHSIIHFSIFSHKILSLFIFALLSFVGVYCKTFKSVKNNKE